MIVRMNSFSGVFRLVLGGIIGFLSAIVVVELSRDELVVSQNLVGGVGAVISILLLGSGLRARRQLRVLRIDDQGIHSCQESSESQSLLWSDVKSIRQCHGKLIVVDHNHRAHEFDCSKTNPRLTDIAAVCLDHVCRAHGVATPRETVAANPPVLCCQKCGKETPHLKDSVFFVVIFAYVYAYVCRAQLLTCPKCTRKRAYLSAIINLVLANVLWPFIVLPLCLLQWIQSFRSGHSRAVVDQLANQMAQELTA